MFGSIIFIPLYLQIVKGASPTRSGLLMLPMMAGIIVTSVLTGRAMSRIGRYKWFPVAGRRCWRRHAAAHRGCRWTPRSGLAFGYHGGDRRRAGAVHAVAGPGRAERGHGAGPGRRHVVGDVLPLARWLVRGGDPRRGAVVAAHRRAGRTAAGRDRPAAAGAAAAVAASGGTNISINDPATIVGCPRRCGPPSGAPSSTSLHLVFLTAAGRHRGGAGHPGPAPNANCADRDRRCPPTTPRPPRSRPVRRERPDGPRRQGARRPGRVRLHDIDARAAVLRQRRRLYFRMTLPVCSKTARSARVSMTEAESGAGNSSGERSRRRWSRR